MLPEWLVPIIIGFGVVLTVLRIVKGPSATVRRKIELALKARSVELIELKTKWPIGLGRSSRLVLIAKGRNVFGTIQRFYFEVDFWAEAFSRDPRVHELGTSLSPLRHIS
jgi:hypothetical protein